jgi:hypothetical protein
MIFIEIIRSFPLWGAIVLLYLLLYNPNDERD